MSESLGASSSGIKIISWLQKSFSIIGLRKWTSYESLKLRKEDIKKAKNQLYKRHLIEWLEEEASYKIHPLIREFLQTKLNESEHQSDYIQSFCEKFIEIGASIPHATTSEIINSVKNAILHLTEVAENHLDAVRNENLCSVFLGLGRFYRGQGLYTLAQPWYEECVSRVKSRLGENHPDTATSLNNLAILYQNQGKYEEAEPLYRQALDIRKQQLGVNHPRTALGLNNLGEFYTDQGKYNEAELLLTQALNIRKQQLGVNHPATATSLNALGLLYDHQGKYKEAESLYLQALEILERFFGSDHPDTVKYRRNLENLRAQQQQTSGDD